MDCHEFVKRVFEIYPRKSQERFVRQRKLPNSGTPLDRPPPAEEATEAPTDAPAEKTGCGASVSMAALLVAACAAFACKARD